MAGRSLEVAGAGARGQQDDRRASLMELVIRENVAAIFRSGECPSLTMGGVGALWAMTPSK